MPRLARWQSGLCFLTVNQIFRAFFFSSFARAKSQLLPMSLRVSSASSKLRIKYCRRKFAYFEIFCEKYWNQDFIGKKKIVSSKKNWLQYCTTQPIEDLILKAHDRCTIQEFNPWKEEDGEQEVMQLMLIVRALRQIIEDLLADPRFKDCQNFSFEMQKRNGVHIFGATNGGIWW